MELIAGIPAHRGIEGARILDQVDGAIVATAQKQNEQQATH